MILIAGAGLAGLSAAFHLGDRDYRIIDKNERAGGLCRTEKVGGQLFDYGGHLLHLRGDDARSLVMELMGDSLTLHARKSAIYSSGTVTPYPFQANTHGLPPEVSRDCLVGFVEALLAARDAEKPENFRDWILYSFGEGFARHFFFPFNEKFFKTDLRNITDEWVSWSIPRPSLLEVVNGALGIQDKSFGYNAEFYYPDHGIEELPKAIARELRHPIQARARLVEVRPKDGIAVLDSGEEIKYEKLVSTVPLDELLGMIKGASPMAGGSPRDLKSLSVFCVNLGVSGPPLSDQHWIYMPGPEQSFHRIGVYSNFIPTEPLMNTLYLEITLPRETAASIKPELPALMDEAVEALKETPFWDEDTHRVEIRDAMLIERGYVVYDEYRKRELPGILSRLREMDIEPAGRYGLWEYSAMEDAIREGRLAARACQKRRG